MNKVRSTKYWFKKLDKLGNENPIPFFIEDHPNDWIQIKDRRELRDIFTQAVVKELGSKFGAYVIYVHKTDIYFTKGVYEKFTQQLKENVGDVLFNNILFKNGFKKDDKLNWHVIKPLFAKEGIEIDENILEGCINVLTDVKNKQEPISKTIGKAK